MTNLSASVTITRFYRFSWANTTMLSLKQKWILAASLLAGALANTTFAKNSTSYLSVPVQSPASKAYPSDQALYDKYPWYVMYYYGATFEDPLGPIIFKAQLHRWPEHIQSVEVARTLNPDNFFRRFVNPLVGVVQLAGNATVRVGSNQNTIYEFDPYLAFRWANMPWNHYVNTSFAIGEGISYDSSVPALERKYSENTKRLLNYLMLEATFAPPSYPQLQMVIRIHHRSGAYGLYHAGNTGSNDLGLGIRYLFD